jgi:Pyruvate/2-oxoacid:ferredoxin oxidoreductase gamma subunit
MSNAITGAQANGGAPKISKISEAIIRIAGNSQDGIQAIGGFLARLAGRSEQEVMTFMTIPATISGGASIFQVRMGSGEVLSSGDEADVLLAFYQHSYDAHLSSVKKGGIVLYDSDHVVPNEDWKKDYHHLGIAISGLTVEAIGGTAKDKGKNIFSLGLIAKMFDLNLPKLEKLIAERFTGKDPSILNNALAAFHAGHANPLGNVLETFKFVDAQKKDGHQIVMNGNEAHRRRCALRRGLSDYAVVRHHGIAPPRAAEIRRHIHPDGRRNRRHLDGHWRKLRWPRVGHRFQRPGNFTQDRSARLGDHGGNAPRHRGRATRRAFDRHADEY